MDKNANTDEYVNMDDIEEGVEGSEGVKKGRIKSFLESKYYILSIFVLVAVISFFLGRISIINVEKAPIKVVGSQGEVKGASTDNPPYIKEGTEKENNPNTSNPTTSNQGESVKVVGSKSGTKYHLPSCPGAKQISAKNLVTFNSIEEARAKGYTPASNCKGLK